MAFFAQSRPLGVLGSAWGAASARPGLDARILNEESPDWTWITRSLIDARTSGRPRSRIFRRGRAKAPVPLYLLVPAGVTCSVSRSTPSASLFSEALALVAVFHFVRHSMDGSRFTAGGWVRRAELPGGSMRFRLSATVYPLAFWMTRLPRNFEWLSERFFCASLT